MSGVAAPGGPQYASGTLGGAGHGTFNATTGLYTAAAGGTLSVLVGECVITGGQFQNCYANTTSGNFTGTPTVTLNKASGSPVLGATSTENLYFQRDAFALAFADLPLPRTAVEASRAYDEDLGLSIRIATQYTISNDAEPTRLDVAYGFASLYRSLGFRMSG
jgi:hypothetical protein